MLNKLDTNVDEIGRGRGARMDWGWAWWGEEGNQQYRREAWLLWHPHGFFLPLNPYNKEMVSSVRQSCQFSPAHSYTQVNPRHTSHQINTCCSLKNFLSSVAGKQLCCNCKAKTLAFKYRQQNATHQEHVTTAFNVEDCNFHSINCEEQWVSGLTGRDWAVPAANDWATDNIINAAQALLKKQFLHTSGLQLCIVLGLTCTLSYTYAFQSEEFKAHSH